MNDWIDAGVVVVFGLLLLLVLAAILAILMQPKAAARPRTDAMELSSRIYSGSSA